MDTTVIIAISIIALGFLILTGLAIWLAVDRQRRNQQPPAVQPPQQSSPKPAYQAPAPASAPATPPSPTAAKQAPSSQSAPASQKAPANLHDPQHSGLYPAAELYDQTLLPTPPKRRTRKPQ